MTKRIFFWTGTLTILLTLASCADIPFIGQKARDASQVEANKSLEKARIQKEILNSSSLSPKDIASPLPMSICTPVDLTKTSMQGCWAKLRDDMSPDIGLKRSNALTIRVKERDNLHYFIDNENTDGAASSNTNYKNNGPFNLLYDLNRKRLNIFNYCGRDTHNTSSYIVDSTHIMSIQSQQEIEIPIELFSDLPKLKDYIKKTYRINVIFEEKIGPCEACIELAVKKYREDRTTNPELQNKYWEEALKNPILYTQNLLAKD